MDESVNTINDIKTQLADLQAQRDQLSAEITDRWGHVVNDIDEVNINPKKTDVYVNIFGVAWKPFYIVQVGPETVELSAFGAE